MTIERKDRIKDTTSSTGTGTITVDGASITGYRPLSTHTSGATVRYLIISPTQSEWEVGEGVWTAAGSTLSRVTVFASSSAGSKVNFSAGVKYVSTLPTAQDLDDSSLPFALGTAAALDVPATGNAASGEVVKGDDTRLSDARTPTSHTHPASAISDSTATGHAVLTAADAAAARSAIGAGTSSFDGDYSSLSGAPTLGTAASKDVGTAAGTVAAGDHTHSAYASTGAVTTSGLTMAPARLLGRSTASTGAVEEIALGSNLSFTGTTLNAEGGGGEGARWIGAGEMIPRVTNGAGIDGEELATNKINLDYLAFDAGTAEYSQASFSWPSGMATMTAKVYWTAASGSGAVVWGVQARCYADDDALDQAQGTAQTVTDTLLAASDTHISAATSAITPGGTVATGNLCVVQVYRDATSGSDTLAVDARLIGIRLEFSA